LIGKSREELREMALGVNTTLPGGEPDWGNTAPAWRLPGWAEPIVRFTLP